MKYYINILLVISAMFFSCAVQSPPSGGLQDTEGPFIKRIDPPNGTFNFEGNIEIMFNEMIDPKTIKSSIHIFPDTELQINSFNNKVVIKAKNHWPKDQIFKIKLSRNISDFNGNKLNKGKVLTYNTEGKMPSGKITGKLFNNKGIANIGLYKIESGNLEFLYSVENNNNDDFEFNNVSNGKYLLVAIENIINDIKFDIRSNRYALMSEEIIINNNAVSNCNLNMSYPAIRKTTKNFSMQNNKFAIIEFNDGEKIFLVDKNYTDKFNTISDNIIPFEDKDASVTIKLNNNIEHYQITQEINREYNVTDNLNPYIDNYFLDQDKIFIKFSEPIYFKNEANIFKELETDSSYNSEKINYELLDPMTLMLSNPSFDLLNIAIENKFIFDLSSNSNILIDTLITITNNSHFSDKKSGGNVFGKIIYEGKNDVIVEAVNLLNSKVNKVKMDKFGNYKFYNLDIGKYQIWAYENLNKVNESYFNGTIEPIQFSAKFGYYNNIIETRSKWDIEDIRIKLN